MASTKYTYSISEDFSNGVDTSRLTIEIQASSIVIALDYIGTDGDNCDIWFKADLSQDDQTTLDGIVEVHSGEPLPAETKIVEFPGEHFDTFGNLLITPRPVAGSGLTEITHNFADPHSWWQTSEEVPNEVATPNGTYDVYTFGVGESVIDIENARITGESDMTMGAYKIDRKYIPVLKKNDEVFPSGYTIDYELGTITLDTPWTETDVMKVTYYKAVNNKTIVVPSPGKMIRMVHVECQFSEDIQMTNKRWMIFDTYVGGPALYKRSIYKTLNDLINESNNRHYNNIPPRDGRTKSLDIFVWDYPATRDLKSALGLYVEIYFKDPNDGAINKPIVNSSDEPLELATGTFYCLSENE